jgi:hypothetical protein
MKRDFKCITFDAEAQRSLPEHIHRKMAEDRKRAAYRCGICKHFDYEDTSGNGYCHANETTVGCGNNACDKFTLKQ